MNLKPVIEKSFAQYAGAVLQSRALVDVRDCLKPSARQIFYCLYTDKFLHSKPFKKTLKAIGSAMRMYIHGDSSCEGVVMRAGQPFAMRYPLIEVEGSYGNLMESGNWAAPRYTSSRLSPLAEYLFKDIEKETIEEWRDNYDDTEQYPAVLSTKGFYNLVNGTSGIGIGAASSIPQFNIKDLNNALITLLQNPDCSFEDIYCPPDFATGAILLNEEEVKQSLKEGTGFACKLRSVIEYNSGERCLIVKEIPYGVYTNTICGELEEIINDAESNPGIDRFNDLTAEKPNIKIYLTKKANATRVIKYLYKNTSLQYYYGINMTMLDNGRFPRVFGWKETLQAHIDHEKEVYRRGYEYDLRKIAARLHIVEGILIALARIEEVVEIIKKSISTAAAKINLMNGFGLSEAQAKAILDMKLSRLAHLEIEKFENEKKSLISQKENIEKILYTKELFDAELIKGWEETAKKFGDARRTQILNIESEEEEPAEIKSLQICLTNKNNLFVSEVSSLYTQRRGGVGNKIKMQPGEMVISTIAAESNEEILFFTKLGSFYHYNAAALPLSELIPLESLFMLKDWERVCAMTSLNKKTAKKHILFFTKNGIIKKSLLSEYNIKRAGSLKALSLDENDEIADVLFTDEDKVGILTEFGNFLLIETKDIRPIGRVTRGVRAIKLNDKDAIVSARIVLSSTKEICSISGAGLIKKTPYSEFVVQGRGTKGAKLHKIGEKDFLADFIPIENETEILIASTSACIKIKTNEIPLLSKGALGNKSIKLKDGDTIIAIAKF